MWVRKNSVDYYAKSESGGKGYNLYLMTQEGIAIPDWQILGTSAHLSFLEASGLDDRINRLTDAFQRKALTARQLSEDITRLMIDTPLPVDLVQQVQEVYEKVAAGGAVSVRSSAADEDGASFSFAGQLSSFLYVGSAEDATRYLKLCWASAYSERAISYRVENNLPLKRVAVAVIFQKMVDPEVSGVMFTCDPAAAHMDSFVVSAVYGVGEGLVSGQLECDTYWVDAASGALLRRDVVDKPHMFRQGPAGGCMQHDVDRSRQGQAALDPSQLDALTAVGRRLRDLYGEPQDVEWAFADGRLYILQSRPVTTLRNRTRGFPNLWDNSNIVESYGGLTSPLTFTFALENYKSVYVQFCEILGVPGAVVKDMEHYLGNMLGCINGRVYYNLYNWYKLVGILPGFKHNRAFMETMMGVGQSLSPEIAARIEPHPSWNSPLGVLRRIRTGLAFVRYHFSIDGMVKRFLVDFDRDYQIYRRKNYSRMRSDELFLAYIDISRTFLNKWKAPIINDFLCMVHFGILNGLTTKWLGHINRNLHNDLLAGEGDMESAEPTKMLIHFAAEIAGKPGLRDLVMATSDYLLLEVLKQSEYQAFYGQVCHYIDRFGCRCASEMKMEVKDLYVDPSFMFACIKNYLRAGITDVAGVESKERALRRVAEGVLDQSLHGVKKIVYRWSLRQARNTLRHRENTRFARTRVYGVVRALFRALGARLRQEGALVSVDDIYYLTLQELYGIHQGTLTSYDLQGLVEVRKKAYREFAPLEPKIRFQTRGPVYWGNDILETPDTPHVPSGADCDLSGIACCPGIVEGKVRVVHSMEDSLVLNGEILVAKRTDPGWVPIFPSISGLLVERGSLLSHSAIVAREMGIPAVVGIKGLLNTLTDGMIVRMDGKSGTIKILAGA
jgi:pyruvate,water dikinase